MGAPAFCCSACKSHNCARAALYFGEHTVIRGAMQDQPRGMAGPRFTQWPTHCMREAHTWDSTLVFLYPLPSIPQQLLLVVIPTFYGEEAYSSNSFAQTSCSSSWKAFDPPVMFLAWEEEEEQATFYLVEPFLSAPLYYLVIGSDGGLCIIMKWLVHYFSLLIFLGKNL